MSLSRAKPRSESLWGALLVLAVILSYLPVWWAGFIWDDDVMITANPCIVGPLGLKEIWTTSATDICPLTMTAFWAEYQLWHASPLPYHLVNVLLHAACAILFWRVLRLLAVPGAWLGAALWALHPVQVESVAWVAEQKNTQSGLFFLLAVLFFVRGLKIGEGDGRSGVGLDYALTLLCAALAMASKFSTVILPVVLCLCAWWAEGRWRWRHMVKLAPIFLFSIIAIIVSLWIQQVEGANDPEWVRTWPERLGTVGCAVWFYLGKLLWPYPLSLIYPRWQIDAGQAISYLPLLAVVVILGLLWRQRQSRARPWFFAFAYFLIALLPALGLVDLAYFRHSFVADHFQYLASMGPLSLAGAGLARLGEVALPDRASAQKALAAGLLIGVGLMTWLRAWAYESPQTIWADTLAKNPSCWVARYNLGVLLLEEGRTDEAIAQYRKALEIYPHHVEAHDDLGIALLQKGETDAAVEQFRLALAINPASAHANNNLGYALLQKGRSDDAMACFQTALKIHPDFAEAHANLGLVLAQKGQLDEARKELQEAVQLKPGYAKARNNLAIVQEMIRQKAQPK